MTDVTTGLASSDSNPAHDPGAAKRHADRDRLIAALAARNIATAVIKFDGSGDEGQIEEVLFFAADGAKISLLAAPEPPALPNGDAAPSLPALQTQLEDFAFDALYDHNGWQDNDGAYGEITLDVVEGTATLDLSQRFVDVYCSLTDL